jgi:hypothetical protein
MDESDIVENGNIDAGSQWSSFACLICQLQSADLLAVSILSPQRQQILANMNRTNSPEEFHRLLQESCDYFDNHLDVSDFGVFGENVDIFQLPSQQTADVLVRSYFATVHPFFPVLSQPEFIAQYQSYLETRHPPNSNIHWIAILNVVFALGALGEHRSQALYAVSDKEHILYFLRSWMLSQPPTQMVDLPTLEHVQYMTISGVYLFASNQMNRYGIRSIFWNVSDGLSLHGAQTGL